VVTGINLPMLLKLYSLRTSGNPIGQIAHDLAEAGQRSIGHVSESLRRMG
jgi:mannose/fructose-specific phosphotransferase system component IIA